MTDLSKDTSNCCGAKPIEETDICSQCKEHAEFDGISIWEAEQKALQDWREDINRNPYMKGSPEYLAYSRKSDELYMFDSGFKFFGGAI